MRRTRSPRRHPAKTWVGIVHQFAVVAAAVLLYFLVRGLTEGDANAAERNAQRLLAFERRIGLDIEAGLQNFVLGRRVLADFANWVYIWGHWPVLIATLVLLYATRREQYFLLRDAMLTSGAIGLLIFATWPVAPPRLLPASNGYVDTLSLWSSSYRVLQPSFLVNKYAALPSYHVGWNLLAGIALWRSYKNVFFRSIAVASPLLMSIAVVATANHYQIDGIVGSVLAVAALLVVAQRRSRRQLTTIEEDPCDCHLELSNGTEPRGY